MIKMTNWEDILKMPFDVPQQQEQSFQANDGFLIKWAEIYLDDRLKNYIQQETIQGKHRIQILDNQGKKEFGRLVSRLGLPRIALKGLSRLGIGGFAASSAIQGLGLLDD